MAVIAAGCVVSLCLGLVAALDLKPNYDPKNEHWGPRLELVSASRPVDLKARN